MLTGLDRMIVLKRTRSGTEAFPTETVDLVGSTGNIYIVSPSLQI
jgi:hypothetical protein